MTSVGKILVVLNLILSVSFIAFSGAVYTTHKTWRKKAEMAEANATKSRADMNTALNELNAKEAEAQRLVAAAEGEVVQLKGQLANVQQQVAAAEKKNNQLEQELQAQTGVAESKTAEAVFRREQAVEQSSVNNSLHGKLETVVAENRSLSDQLFSRNLSYEQLEDQYAVLLSETADLKTVLDANGLSTNIADYRSMDEPPPPVEGLVVNARKDRTGNVRYVAMSIGSDDGLDKGHELSVVRPAERNQGRAKFLGTVVIIDVDNDTAVGRVIDTAKTGIIEEGDNVTSKL